MGIPRPTSKPTQALGDGVWAQKPNIQRPVVAKNNPGNAIANLSFGSTYPWLSCFARRVIAKSASINVYIAPGMVLTTPPTFMRPALEPQRYGGAASMEGPIVDTVTMPPTSSPYHKITSQTPSSQSVRNGPRNFPTTPLRYVPISASGGRYREHSCEQNPIQSSRFSPQMVSPR